MRRFAQTQIRTKHTPNLRSFLLEHSCKDDLLFTSPRLLICCNDLAKSYSHRIPLLYPRYPYLEFRVSIYRQSSENTSCPKNNQLDKLGDCVGDYRSVLIRMTLSWAYASCVFASAQICAKFDLLKVSALLVLLSFLFHQTSGM